MEYKVVVTADAVDDMEGFIRYIIYEKRNPQAAASVLDDFEAAVNSLKTAAESLKLCDNPKLNTLGYRRYNSQRHRYFLMYRVIGETVVVDNVFHELQDYENILI